MQGECAFGGFVIPRIHFLGWEGRVWGLTNTRGRHSDSWPQLTFSLITQFLRHSSHSSCFLLYVRGPLWRPAAERTITGPSRGADWAEDGWQTVNKIVYSWYLLSGARRSGFGLFPACLVCISSIFDSMLFPRAVFCFVFFVVGTVLEQRCDVLCMTDWYDTGAPVFYWSRCHVALCWAWLWWRSAVSCVAQSPVVRLACCQCHSAAPYGAISMLSVDLCRTSSWQMPPPPSIPSYHCVSPHPNAV